MKVPYYYIIRGNQRLKEKLQEYHYGQDVIAILTEPVMWTKEENGKTAWTSYHYTLQVKLLFLVYLVKLYKDGELEGFIAKLLGGPPYKLETFDKWWEIERLGLDEFYEEIESRLSIEEIQSIQKPGDTLVDSWLDFIVREKSQQ